MVMRSLFLFALYSFLKSLPLYVRRVRVTVVGSGRGPVCAHRPQSVKNCHAKLNASPATQRATAQAASPAQLHGIQQRERPALDEADAEVPGYAQQQ